jgi:thiamine biosynthesis lipoprotein ApbE
MQSFALDIIGTHLDIRIDTDRDCSVLFAEIETRLQDFEQKYSRFISGNWLDVLNQKRTATLDIDGQKMLTYMLTVSANTDGYFDPTVGKRLTELGYGKRSDQNIVPVIPPEDSGGIQASKKWNMDCFTPRVLPMLRKGARPRNDGNGNYRDIELDWDRVTLHGDILLEFGWVGKGYLIDVIQEMIDNWLCHIDRNSAVSVTNGVEISCSENWAGFLDYENHGNRFSPLEMTETRYLINFWGDMYGRGGWTVGLESPFASDEVIGTLFLDDHFLACSAGTRRKWGTHHHLIDPHTGESANSVIASYIEWASGMIVDSYATALCVMPWELAITTLQKTPEISGVIISAEGNIYQKEGSRAEVFR